MIAFLHPGQPVEPHDLLGAWSFDAWVLIALAVSAALYATGLRRIWKRAGRGRGIRTWQAASFAAGWITLLVAMVSPLHELGGALFAAHMTQHELLMVVAAPLLVLGRPLVPALWALPMGWRKRAGSIARGNTFSSTWRNISAPAAAWLIHAAAIWAWHVPALYQSTLISEGMHTLQHISFLGTALLFWWALIHHRHARLSYGTAVIYVFTTALHTSALGALLTFASAPWYPEYATSAAAWGFTALEDQQLAGLIMWVPAGVAYLVAALFMMAEWLRESDRSAARWRKAALGASTASLVVMLAGCGMGHEDQTMKRAAAMTGGDPRSGALLIEQYGCSSCHTIPGIAGADRKVGPSLEGIATRMYIAGILPNNPESMKQWIMNPPSFDPKTAMPNLGVNAADASDIAAYLYTLDD